MNEFNREKKDAPRKENQYKYISCEIVVKIFLPLASIINHLKALIKFYSVSLICIISEIVKALNSSAQFISVRCRGMIEVLAGVANQPWS